MVDAAQQLAAWGVSAITSDCGLMLRHERAVAQAVDVPVGLSSMLLLPLALATCRGRVGIVAANSANVTAEALRLAGVDEAGAGRIVVGGMEAEPCFASAVLSEAGWLDVEAIGDEVVAVATRLVDEHPDVAALLFDCVDLPPHAHTVAAATGRSVFDHVALVEHLQRVARPPAPASQRRLPYGTRDRATVNHAIGGLWRQVSLRLD